MTDRIIIPTAKDGVILCQLTHENRRPLSDLGQRNIAQLEECVGCSRKLTGEEFLQLTQIEPSLPGELRFGICEAGHIAGFVRIAPRIGMPWYGGITYWLGSEFTRRGLATETLKALSDHMFTRPIFAHLFAWVRTENVRSQRALTRAAYTKIIESEGTLVFRRSASDPAE